MTDIHTHEDDVDDTQVIQLHLDSDSEESDGSTAAAVSTGFVFLFFDRTIEEGQQFLLYAYPRAAQTTTRILSMQGVLSALEGAMSGVTGQKVEIATFVESSDPLPSSNAAPGPLHIKVCSREVGEPAVGLAFICLQWSLTSSHLMSDLDLVSVSGNILSSLRLCMGSLRLASFQMHNSPKTAQQQFVTFEQMSDASFSLIRSMSEHHFIPSPLASTTADNTAAEASPDSAAKFAPRCTPASAIVFDAFFERMFHTVCRDITSSSDTLYKPMVNSPPPLSRILDAKERESYQRSKRAALHTAHSSFLSPSYVPTDLPPSALASTPDSVRAIDREIGSLLQQFNPVDANSRQRLTLPVLGALLYHQGGLVHVSHSPAALSQLTRFNASSPTSSPVSSLPSLASPRRPQFLSSLQVQSNEWNTDTTVPLLRHQDVHELTNFITLLGLSRRSKSNRGEYISPRSPQSPPLQYAGTHQLYFSYAHNEITPRDFSKARGAFPSPSSWSGSDTLDNMASPLNLDMIPTTRANSEDEKAPHYTLTAINHSNSTTSSSVAFSPSSSLKKSNSESNLALHASADVQQSKSDANKNPSMNLTVDANQVSPTNQRILQARTVTVLQLGRNRPSSTEEKEETDSATDLILVLVQDASDAPQQHGPSACDDATFQGLCLPASFRSIFTRSDCVLPLYRTLLKMYAQLKIPQHLSSLHSDNPTGQLWSLQSLADGMTQRVVPPSPPLHQRSHTSAAILSSSLRIDANAMAAADSQLVYEFVMLDTHRGVVVRSVSTPASQLPSLPVSFELDFLHLTRKIHKTFRTFKHLFINTSTAAYNAATTATINAPAQASANSIPSVPPQSTIAASSPTGSPLHTRSMSFNPLALNLQVGSSPSMNYVDPHASAESLGKGNHLYFRRHKTMETVRHVHECGFRLNYSSGLAFWVKGRLLPNGSEVFVCVDQSLPDDALETAFSQVY